MRVSVRALGLVVAVGCGPGAGGDDLPVIPDTIEGCDVPDRGVRATSSSGGGASPCAIDANVLAVRAVLPRAI